MLSHSKLALLPHEWNQGGNMLSGLCATNWGIRQDTPMHAVTRACFSKSWMSRWQRRNWLLLGSMYRRFGTGSARNTVPGCQRESNSWPSSSSRSHKLTRFGSPWIVSEIRARSIFESSILYGRYYTWIICCSFRVHLQLTTGCMVMSNSCTCNMLRCL